MLEKRVKIMSDKKLYRSTNKKMLAGVCGGISELSGLDVTIVRLIWVVGSFLLGFFVGGIIIYLICALIIPIQPDHIDI